MLSASRKNLDKNLQKIFKIIDENGNENITLQKTINEVNDFIIDNIYIENVGENECDISDKCWIIRKKDTSDSFDISNGKIFEDVFFSLDGFCSFNFFSI